MSIFGSSCDKLAFTVKLRVRVKKESSHEVDGKRYHHSNSTTQEICEAGRKRTIECNFGNIGSKIFRCLKSTKPEWLTQESWFSWKSFSSLEKEIKAISTPLKGKDLIDHCPNNGDVQYDYGLEIVSTIFIPIKQDANPADVITSITEIANTCIRDDLETFSINNPSMHISVTNLECTQCDQVIDRDSKNSGGRGRY